MDAISATIDTAVAQKQSEGGDASALTGLKMRMEGALSGAVETRSVHSVANHTVDALIALPREALSNAEYASLMSAYRMYEANPSDANAASVVAAGKQALDSMDIVQLEQSGVLTQSQASALAEVKAEIENIDSANGVGDNGNAKPTNPLYDAKAHTDKSLQSIIKGEGHDVNEFAALLDADRVLTPKEKALIRRVLQKIGTPKKGTEMQKSDS